MIRSYLTILLVASAGIDSQAAIITQQAYLKPAVVGDADRFGYDVAISGDTLVVGALGEDSAGNGVNSGTENDNSANNAGAAYVFVRSGTGEWTQQAYLKASNSEAGDLFSRRALAIDNNTIVVGAIFQNAGAVTDAGAAYVFFRTGVAWAQQAILTASNAQTNDRFGENVSVSGDTIVVGAGQEDSAGTGVNSGTGANNGATDAGAAYVFFRTGTAWAQQAYLKASNTGAGDGFAYSSVAISGDTIVVGAAGEDTAGTDAGAAYVFFRTGVTWAQQFFLQASNAEAGDRFGHYVAIDGDTIVVGAAGEDSNSTGEGNNSFSESGAAYVFVRTGTSWTQQAYLKSSNPETGDALSENTWTNLMVAISGDAIVLGFPGEDGSGTGVNSAHNNVALRSGAAYVFTRKRTIWTQEAYLKPPVVATGDEFGFAVAISGATVVVGSVNEDSAGTGVNSGTEANNGSTDSGAVFVFFVQTSNFCKVLVQDGWLVGTEANCCPNTGLSGPASVGPCTVAYPAALAYP